MLCDGCLASSRHGDWPPGAPLPSHLPREQDSRMRGPGGSGTTHRSDCPQQHGGSPQTPERGAGGRDSQPLTHRGADERSSQLRAGQEDGPECSQVAKCPGGVSALTVPSSLGLENKPPDKEVWVPVVWLPQWGRGLPHSTQPGARQVKEAQGTWPGGLRSQHKCHLGRARLP